MWIFLKLFKFDYENVLIVYKIIGIEGLYFIILLLLLFLIWFDRDVVILMRYIDIKR